MVQKPSLASLLVAPQRQLAPQHSPGQVVGIPHAPPSNIRFGSSPPGFAQSSRYTGGAIVPQGASSSVYTPPDFVAPTYTSPQVNPVVAATVAALMLHGGGLTPFRPPAPPPTNPPAPGTRAVATPAPGPQPPGRAQAQPGQVAGFTPHDVGYSDVTRTVAQPGQFPVPSRVSSSALANPAIGRRGVYNF